MIKTFILKINNTKIIENYICRTYFPYLEIVFLVPSIEFYRKNRVTCSSINFPVESSYIWSREYKSITFALGIGISIKYQK